MKLLKIIFIIILVLAAVYVTAKIKYADEHKNLKFLKKQQVNKKIQGPLVLPTEVTRLDKKDFKNTDNTPQKAFMLWKYQLPSYFQEPEGRLYLTKDSTVQKIIISKRTLD